MSEMKRLLLLMEDAEKESGRKDRDDIKQFYAKGLHEYV